MKDYKGAREGDGLEICSYLLELMSLGFTLNMGAIVLDVRGNVMGVRCYVLGRCPFLCVCVCVR